MQNLPLLLGLPGGAEWLIILAVFVLLFGASAIPKIARSIGRAQGEFKTARAEFESNVAEGSKDAEKRSKLEKTATDLGISVDGKSDDELRAEIQAKLS